MENATIKMLRERTPEALALGGWFVRIEYPTPRGTASVETDFCRSRHGAVIAGLGLAFRLGIDVQTGAMLEGGN